MLGREYPAPVNLKRYFASWYPDDEILHSFYIRSHHSADSYCEYHFAREKDIRQKPEIVKQMLGHLKTAYGNDFDQEKSLIQAK